MRCGKCRKPRTNFTKMDLKPDGSLFKNCKGCRLYNVIYIKEYDFENRLKKKIHATKQSDKKANIFDEATHIDLEFLENQRVLQEDKCIYCWKKMSLTCDYFADELLTVERKDNSLGHSCDNTVLACLRCNLERGDRHTYEDYHLVHVARRSKLQVQFLLEISGLYIGNDWAVQQEILIH